MLSAAVLLSFAWHFRYTYEFLDFTQHCSNPGLMHSNNAWDYVHAFCSSPAQLCLAPLGTPMSFWTSHNTAVTQGSCTATLPGTLCMLFAAVLLSFAWHSKYSYEFLDFTSHCSNPGLMHNNNAWDSVHAFCTSIAQLCLALQMNL